MTAEQFLAKLNLLLQRPDGVEGADGPSVPARIVTQRYHPTTSPNKSYFAAPFDDRRFPGLNASQGVQIIPRSYYDTIWVTIRVATAGSFFSEPMLLSFGMQSNVEGVFTTGSSAAQAAFAAQFPPHYSDDFLGSTSEAHTTLVLTPLTDAPFIVWFLDDAVPDTTTFDVTVTLLNVRHG